MSKLLIPFLKLLSFLPLWLLHRIAWFSYILLFHVFKVRRKLTLNNIKASFPEYSESECFDLAKSHYQSTCMVIAETVKALSLSKEEIKNRVEFKNLHVLENYLEQGQSAIIVTAHYCNFEWALLACAQHLNFPVDTVYRKQRTDNLESLFYNLRTRFDVTPLPMETCVADSLKRSKITRMLAMAADQSPKKDDSPYWHLFLNRDTAFHTGTEKIARAFKYPIIFMSLKRTRKGYYQATLKLLAEPPFTEDPNQIMRLYISELETLVQESPKDWLWAYRRWKLKKPSTTN
ncbi:MAG: lysophospholipid acyltransferase family protein [Gammaproteobacteria bacterium]